MFKETFKKNEGITLIALVITIIVLLILSGISMAMLIGENGILNKTVESKTKTQDAQVEEKIKLATVDAMIADKGTLKDETLKEALNNIGISNENIKGNEKKGWIVKENGKSYKINSNGNVKELIELPSQKGVTEPYLPEDDFKMEEGTNLNTGLVVKDNNGNEFVWVEVPKTIYTDSKYNTNGIPSSENEFEKIRDCLKKYTSDYSESSFTDESQNGYTEEYKNMLKSVYINGGFWIGRYEAGIEDGKSYRKAYEELKSEDKPVVKQNMYPYNYVTRDDAKKLAGRMGYENCTSSLLYGIQWDLVLKYLETKNVATLETLKINSTDNGNYNNNLWNITNEKVKYSIDYGNSFSQHPDKKTYVKDILLTTGADKSFSLMNIYDIAGNVWEWTLEYGDSNCPLVARGGAYNVYGSGRPAVYRAYNTMGKSHTVGFRIGLWEKD